MNILLIGCRSLWREVAYAASQSPHHIRLELLSPEAIQAGGLTELMAEVGDDYDAAVLAVGGCALPLRLPEAIAWPVLMPRVHDCAGLLLGSRERQREVFNAADGACHYLMGEPACHALNPHGDIEGSVVCLSSPVPGAPKAHAGAREASCAMGVSYREAAADLALITRLVTGDWNEEDFLVLSPGQGARKTCDLGIMAACED